MESSFARMKLSTGVCAQFLSFGVGTGGLVKAYTEAAQSVVNTVERGRRVPVHVAMMAIPYNLLERVRLLFSKNLGKVLGEDYAGDITITLQFPVENFEIFQKDMREISAGKIQAEVIETKEEIVKV